MTTGEEGAASVAATASGAASRCAARWGGSGAGVGAGAAQAAGGGDRVARAAAEAPAATAAAHLGRRAAARGVDQSERGVVAVFESVSFAPPEAHLGHLHAHRAARHPRGKSAYPLAPPS